MSNNIKDGGPAYPSGKSEQAGWENSLPYYEGMSLRDWFAGQALPALIGNMRSPELLDNLKQIAKDDGVSVEQIFAAASYEYADAMIAAREVQP